MIVLTPSERRALRARAHPLKPVVLVGQHGLTPAVLREIDIALKAHELVKIRVMSDDRNAREALDLRICAELHAAPVQHLGKILTLWRPNPEEQAKAKPNAKSPPPTKAPPRAKAPPPSRRRRRSPG